MTNDLLRDLERLVASLKRPKQRLIVGSPFVASDRCLRYTDEDYDVVLVGEAMWQRAYATMEHRTESSPFGPLFGLEVETYSTERHAEFLRTLFRRAIAEAERAPASALPAPEATP